VTEKLIKKEVFINTVISGKIGTNNFILAVTYCNKVL
jgi:hypothetical protein